MPLSEPTSPRELLHTRRIIIEGFRRADGLWDIDGHLTDTKDHDVDTPAGVRQAGIPFHSMRLRLTVNPALTIVSAEATTEAMPYAGICNSITPEYSKLVGLPIRAGFHRAVQECLGGVRGCTHLTELVRVAASAAVQTLSTELNSRRDVRPFQLDGCHAWSESGRVVQEFYPQWYRHSSPISDAKQQSSSKNEVQSRD